MSLQPTSALNPFSLSKWMAVHFSGWLLGVFFVLLSSGLLESVGITGRQFYLGIAMAIGLGIFQWFYLKQQQETPVQFLLYTILGMGLPWIFIDFISPLSQGFNLFTSVAFGSVFSAGLQARVLNFSTKITVVWIICSAVGWLAAAACLLLTETTMHQLSSMPKILIAVLNLLLILSGGPIIGFFTGIALKKWDTAAS